jgi:hypothetical protein
MAAVASLFDRLGQQQPVRTVELSQAQKLQPAQTLLTWLQRHWNKPTISEREIRIFGPRCCRDRETASASAEVLVRHNWLNPVSVRRRDSRAWEIIRRPVLNPTVATPVATVAGTGATHGVV